LLSRKVLTLISKPDQINSTSQCDLNQGLTYINGFDHPDIISGAGTMGIEVSMFGLANINLFNIYYLTACRMLHVCSTHLIYFNMLL